MKKYRSIDIVSNFIQNIDRCIKHDKQKMEYEEV